MSTERIQQELGRFIILFQAMEDAVKEIIILISDNKEYVAKAFLTKTEFRAKIEVADVIYTHFVNITANTNESAKNEFHELMNACKNIGEDRNNIVHSVYFWLKKTDGSTALIQENPRLKFKGGAHILSNEKELSLDKFREYCDKVQELLSKIESHRLKVIEWMHPV